MYKYLSIYIPRSPSYSLHPDVVHFNSATSDSEQHVHNPADIVQLYYRLNRNVHILC